MRRSLVAIILRLAPMQELGVTIRSPDTRERPEIITCAQEIPNRLIGAMVAPVVNRWNQNLAITTPTPDTLIYIERNRFLSRNRPVPVATNLTVIQVEITRSNKPCCARKNIERPRNPASDGIRQRLVSELSPRDPMCPERLS